MTVRLTLLDVPDANDDGRSEFHRLDNAVTSTVSTMSDRDASPGDDLPRDDQFALFPHHLPAHHLEDQ